MTHRCTSCKKKVTDSFTDNLKSRDASASKNQFADTKKDWKERNPETEKG